MNRRQAILHTAFAAPLLTSDVALLELLGRSHYRIGACDWSLNRTCNPDAFEYARQIGLQGVQVSYNTAKDESYLLRPENQRAIRAASKRTGVKIASLAIGELNRVPLKSEARTVEWVSGSIEAAKALGVKVVLLAFFSKGDLRNDEAGKKTVIERLKVLAPQAEKKGVILGIESYLSAQEHLEMIEAIGSPNVQVYYDPRNAADAGHDAYTEIPLLGARKLICEIHLKDNEFMLGQGSLDWPRLKKLLDETGFKGWAQIEWSVPKGKTIEECYPQNVAYAKSVFG
ncbi:MAG: sugar phosphate isomerase/epimerase family protein [Runella sp.]